MSWHFDNSGFAGDDDIDAYLADGLAALGFAVATILLALVGVFALGCLVLLGVS